MNGQETELEPRLVKACARAGRINEDNLRRLLADNRDTVFGKKYGFGSMETSAEYRRRVPKGMGRDRRKALAGPFACKRVRRKAL